MGDQTDMRATDKRVFELCSNFENHVARFERHEQIQESKFDRLIKSQQAGLEATAELSKSVASLVKETRAIVQLERDFKGAVRVGSAVQDFCYWLTKLGIIGATIATAIYWFLEYFYKN